MYLQYYKHFGDIGIAFDFPENLWIYGGLLVELITYGANKFFMRHLWFLN